MAAERFSLLLESRTTGTAEVAKLEEALKRVSDIAERSSKKTEEAARKSSESFRKANDSLKQQASDLKNVFTNPLGAAGEAAESFALKFGKIGVVTAGVSAGLTAATPVL
jgi:C4-type Zn-finger protein